MNAKNKINLKKVSEDDPKLPGVIKFSIGYPTEDKIVEIIRSYATCGSQMAFIALMSLTQFSEHSPNKL